MTDQPKPDKYPIYKMVCPLCNESGLQLVGEDEHPFETKDPKRFDGVDGPDPLATE